MLPTPTLTLTLRAAAMSYATLQPAMEKLDLLDLAGDEELQSAVAAIQYENHGFCFHTVEVTGSNPVSPIYPEPA